MVEEPVNRRVGDGLGHELVEAAGVKVRREGQRRSSGGVDDPVEASAVSLATGSRSTYPDLATIPTTGRRKQPVRAPEGLAAQAEATPVEAGVKALNECVRVRTGRSEDGDSLMTVAFSPTAPLLRVNSGRSKSDESEQRGHMHLCQGVVGAWRNPRAHSLIDDEPARALMMLETIDTLIATTKAATRARKRKVP